MVKEITRDMVLRVYSGKPGCCCGCLGKYTEVSNPSRGAKGAVTRILNAMNERIGEVKNEDTYFFLDLGHKWLIAYTE